MGKFRGCKQDQSDSTHLLKIRVIASLSDYWIPLELEENHNTADPVQLLDIPRVALSTIEFKVAPGRTAVIAVHESPLQRETYRVWLHITYFEPRVLGGFTDSALLCRFRLSIPGIAGGQFSWRQQSSTPVEREPQHRLRGISYSGHALALHWSPVESQRVLPPEIPPAPIIVGTPERTR
ncbi:hypothetical protein C8R44DRAFT_856762 [Mycena epipterygia]|nr:hypothetical protein C8R44DRAFT_856762 [Mycena epipterygia]